MSVPPRYLVVCNPTHVDIDPSLTEEKAWQFLQDHCGPLPKPETVYTEKIKLIKSYESCFEDDGYYRINDEGWLYYGIIISMIFTCK